MRTIMVAAVVLAVGCGGESPVVTTNDAAVVREAAAPEAAPVVDAAVVVESAAPETAAPEASMVTPDVATPEAATMTLEADTESGADVTADVTATVDSPAESATLPCCVAAELSLVTHPGCLVCAVDSGAEAATLCCYGTPLVCGLPCRDH